MFNKTKRFSVVHTFKAQNVKEIDINRGDLILVYRILDDGWYIGLSLQTGKFGKFPGHYVIPHHVYTD
jgi:hypothetical protein